MFSVLYMGSTGDETLQEGINTRTAESDNKEITEESFEQFLTYVEE